MEKILLNNLGTAYFENFLSISLKDTYLQKVQSLEKDENGLKIKIKNKDKNLDLIFIDGLLFITKYNYSTTEKSNFSKKINSLLKNEKIINIKQKDLEKIIIFEFNHYYLIFELFSHNNVILTDKEHNILSCLLKEKWADREISIGKKYLFPKTEKENPKKISGNYQTNKDLVSNLNIPPSLFNLLCTDNLKETIKKIEEIYNSEILKNETYLIKTKKLEYFPIKINGEKINSSFNDILDDFYNNPDNFKKEKKINKKVIELENTIEKIDVKIKEFGENIDLANKSAKWIEENYVELETIQKAINKGLSKGLKESEIINILKKEKNKYPLLEYLEKIDLKNKKISFLFFSISN